MDPSDDVEPSPPKKPRPDCSDAQKAAYTSNFGRRHKKKGRGRSKNTSVSRHTDGSKNKSSSYDFAGVGERLGTGPNSRAIQSTLMPATVPLPKKPTVKEYVIGRRPTRADTGVKQRQSSRRRDQEAGIGRELQALQGGGCCRACQGAVHARFPGEGQRKGGRGVRSGAW